MIIDKQVLFVYSFMQLFSFRSKHFCITRDTPAVFACGVTCMMQKCGRETGV